MWVLYEYDKNKITNKRKTKRNKRIFRHIANGGNGHWNGDGCCNDSTVPTSNIDMGISMLLVVAIGIILYLKYRVS